MSVLEVRTVLQDGSDGIASAKFMQEREAPITVGEVVASKGQ
ncbi:hypothetical protein [Deinococcus hopiensis]|nr:hypothetical protein [Deinococcus hopiensis]